MKDTNNSKNFQSTVLENKFFVIGIGASAGGLKALEDFLENMPADNGASFIVIQHLSPDFKSLMKELLERRTPMAVYRVTDGMKLQPNSVYLIPPRNNVILENRHLRLIEQVEEGRHRFNFPINLCFQSLAADCGDRAIGVILSGTGSDGTQGLQAISQAGGIALAQSPTTAEFDGMPQSAIATGLVDRVLSPRDLARTIYEIVRTSNRGANSSESVLPEIDRVKLEQIVGILTDRENIDFSYYKVSTLSRRIHRRCSMTGCDALEDYIAYLQASSEERKLLQEDLSIGVTSFFRDPKAWEYLEKHIFPDLLEQTKPSDQIRVWVTACATGEEAYSMAILLDEAIQKSGKSVNLKIFATDIDSAALEKASKGVYSETIANELSSDRLQRYFTFKDGSFYVNQKLREMAIFAPHNLAKNAGFSKMNLITCRNVLIYMQPQLQRRVMRMLHFSLIPKGILFLGAAETLGELEDEFEPLDKKWKIFRKRRDVRLPFFSPGTTPINRTATHSLQLDSGKPRLDPLLNRAFASFLQERRATCFLVNRDNELLHVFSDAARLLQVPKGWMTREIAQMMPQALQLPLTIALHRAKRENKPVLYTGITLREGDKVRRINLRVTYEEAKPMATDFLTVVIEDEAKPQVTLTAEPFQGDTKATQQILELKYELQQTKENLQATIKELEIANKEQQATNEELLASNEELQSTNEELHSVNEEIYTVNTEYQSKIQELTELNNDLDNLLRGTDIGVIFLDEDLKIRKFTPAATAAINLVDADINRPIEHFSNNMNCFDLVEQLRQVVATRQTREREVEIVKTGEKFLMRVHPYQNETLEYEGLVLTFIKIDRLKQIQAELERQTAELEYLYQNIPVGLALVDEELRYIKANERLSQMNGVPVEQIIGATVAQVIPELKDKVEPILRQVLNTGESVENFEVSGVTAAAPNVQRDWIASYHPVELPGGRRFISVVVNEITEFKQAQKALQASQERLKLTLLATGIGTWWWEPQPDRITWDDRIHQLYGLSADRMPLTFPDWLQLIHSEDRQMVEQRVTAALEDRQSYEVEFRIVWPDGSIRWLAARAKVERDAQKRPIRMLGSNIDITDKRQAQADLQLSEERLHHLIDLLPHQIFATNAEGRFILANQATARAYGVSVDRLVGKLQQELHPDRDWVEQILLQEQRIMETGQQLVLPEENNLDPEEPQKVFQVIKTPMPVSEFEQPAVLSVAVDITERKQNEEALRKRAFYDPLTELPNRDLLIERLKHAIHRSERQDSPLFAVLFLDLDGFKEINDSMGHLVGDRLLIFVAEKLQECIRPGDTVSRLGGDEFAVLLEQIDSEQHAMAIAARIHRELSAPVKIEGKRVFTSTSIGIALYAPSLCDSENASKLLENADMAMYRAKEVGPGHTRVYTPGMRSEAEALVEIKTELREALEREEFIMHYQPIIDLQTGRLNGLEALVRWERPDRGLISPGKFLPIAQRSNMLTTLERWILKQTCTQFQQWLEQIDKDNSISVSVNISAENLSDRSFVAYVSSVLKETKLAPHRLILELTESSLVENAGLTSRIIASLQSMGIRIALDDFGTGYSSLSHLYRFHLDTIKIDRSFISQVQKGQDLSKIVRGIIYTAKQLDLNVTAEGIETTEQLNFLHPLGCQFGQGFLFAKPLCASEIAELICSNPVWENFQNFRT